MNKIVIKRDEAFITDFNQALQNEESLSTWELFKLTYQSERTMMIKDFVGLQALRFLPQIEFLPHQIETAEIAIQQMNGRAILADEVGLGKTIEAGLILKEYMVRGFVERALLLVPASLVNQWVQELNEKFFIPAVAYRKNISWEHQNIIVASIDTAKRTPHRAVIEKIKYDFLLVDEAHRLKNHRTINYSFVHSIKKKYCLLLTATPIQNELSEIFNLVSILKPGHLGNYETFVKRFGKDRRKIKKDQSLQKLIRQVMVRNRRKDTILKDIQRNIETIWVDFEKEELHLYKKIEQLKNYPMFSKIVYLREFCSSREACFLSLKKLLEDDPSEKEVTTILDQMNHLPLHQKAVQLLELIQRIGDKKIIIFTEYRATQLFLQWFLQQHGIQSVPFRGGFKTGKKDWMQQLFKSHAQVLIATEAGSEGINLQFCHHLINYDLPWNPMKLEQRIGRIHRYGQKENIHIYNFAIRDTIEEHIMHLLYEKINLFEKVIGELDCILESLHISDFEKELMDIFSNSKSQGEREIKLKNLSAVIEEFSKDYKDEGHFYGNT